MTSPQHAAIEARTLRLPAAAMLAAGALLPLLGHPGLACPLRTATGIPCPLCGMSTSVQETVHGDLGSALAASPAGPVLVVVAIWGLVGRGRLELPAPSLLAGAVLAGLWLFQLFRFSVL